jgi:hypothetical protein
MKYTPARSFAAKTIAAGVAAVTFASAGVALAATGNLPSDGPGNGWGFGLQKDEAEEIEPVEEVTEEEVTDEDVVEDETTDEDVVEEETTEEEVTDEAPAAFNGLCRAFTVGNKDTNGKALDAPPFLALSEAAGGEEFVEAYCATLFAEDTDTDTDTDTSTEKAKKAKKTKKAKKAKKTKKDRPVHPHAGEDSGDETGDDTP